MGVGTRYQWCLTCKIRVVETCAFRKKTAPPSTRGGALLERNLELCSIPDLVTGGKGWDFSPWYISLKMCSLKFDQPNYVCWRVAEFSNCLSFEL